MRLFNLLNIAVLVGDLNRLQKPARYTVEHHLRVFSWDLESLSLSLVQFGAFSSLLFYLGLESAPDIHLIQWH